MKRLTATLALACGAAAAAPALAQQAVQVRGGQHEDFGRIVFDWPEKVKYRVVSQGDQLRIEFDTQASFQTGQLLPALQDYIGQPASGPHGYRITFPLKGEYGIEDSTYGNKVVIDLKDPRPEREQALPSVNVRAGAHDRYDRVVFDWPERVAYNVSKDRAAGQATVTFGRPAQLDLTDYREANLSRILALTPFPGDEEVSAELDVKPGARIRDFRLDNRVVVDVFDPGATPESMAEDDAGEDEQQKAERTDSGGERSPDGTGSEATGGTEESGDTETADTSETATGTGGQTDAGEESTPETATDQEDGADEAGPGEPTELMPQAGDDGDQGAARQGPSAPSISGSDEDDGAGAANVQQAAAVQPPSATGQQGPKTGVHRMEYTPERIAQGLAPKAGEIPRHIPPTEIALPWAGDTAAVFRRGGSLFLVAEGAPGADFAQKFVNAADGVNKVEQREKDGLAIIRMYTAPEMGARLLSAGDGWKLGLRPRAALPARPIQISVEEGRVLLKSNRPGKVITMEDPGSGGLIHVATVGTQGEGVQLEKRFQEFSLLPTTQGAVALPRAGGVVMEAADKGFVVRRKTGQLAVSETDLNRNAQGQAAALDGDRLLKLREWRRSETPFSESRQKLQDKVQEAPTSKKHLARLEIARFYFAHGLATETLGALRLYTDKTERRESDPQVKLMKGASHLLAGDWKKAGAALASPVLDGEREALPWRAAHAMAAGNDQAALAAFERSKGLLEPYPPSVRKQLRIWAADSYLRTGNVPKAEQQLSKLRAMDLTDAERAEVKYLTARQMLLSDQVDKAERLWNEVGRSSHAPSRARARLVMIERDLAADRISQEKAIERLERLRFSWRGDEFEAVLLNRLADLYLEQENYRRALETLEQVASHLPGTPQAERATERMRDVFASLFLDGKADSMEPVKALALYEDFRELTPPGERGNRLIAELADRLVEVDLLGRAAELLKGQVENRLSGQAKSAAGARLASIRLLDRAPQKAIEALNESQADNLPPDLRRKRRHLRARAHLEAGNYERALVPVAGDTSPEATRIRARIHADQGNWQKAAENLAGLLPEKPGEGETLSKAERDKVMRQAVALTMADNAEGLAKLRRTYGDAMAGSEQADTFDMLTSDDTTDPTQAEEQLAQVARARTFVDGFLNSLRQQASLDN